MNIKNNLHLERYKLGLKGFILKPLKNEIYSIKEKEIIKDKVYYRLHGKIKVVCNFKTNIKEYLEDCFQFLIPEQCVNF